MSWPVLLEVPVAGIPPVPVQPVHTQVNQRSTTCEFLLSEPSAESRQPAAAVPAGPAEIDIAQDTLINLGFQCSGLHGKAI